MIFDDDDYLSVRNGTPQGKATENRMLDAMGGQDTIKKRFQTNADGSVVMAHTRGPGTQPEFITSLTASIPVEATAYMESGQLEWTYPAPLSPTRLDPASWHFLDIFTTQDYEGKISYAHSTLGQQLNVPSLAEGQASIAVDGTETSVLKKIVMGLFPASLFSGKMRRFIQAQYGAKNTPGNFKLTVELSGSSAILQYVNGGTITFGTWAHNTPGIFAASDGSWWLLSITGGPNYVVTAYRLVPNGVARSLINEYQISDLTDDVKAKLECYIFAHCTIDASNPQSIGSFAGANGSAMAYGWKWKMDGSRASIVVHETLGTGSHDLRWKSSTMHVDFTYTPIAEPSASNFSVSSTISVSGEWTDGWGTYNIFVPVQETSQSPMQLFSLAVSTASVKPKFSFAGVEVYGYYVGDVWQPIVISRNIAGPTGYTQNNNGQFYNPGQESATNNFTYSHDLANVSNHYDSKNITSGTEMTVSIGGASFIGTIETGVFTEYDFSNGGGGNYSSVAYATSQVGDTGSPFFGLPDGYATFDDTGGVQFEWGYANRLFYQFTGTRYKAWALVIASRDCESCYVATHTYDGSGSYIHEESTGRSITRFFSAVDSFIPFRGSFHFGGTFGFSVNRVDVSDTNPPPSYSYDVYCFNTAIQAVQGIPGGSYYALFNVEYTYPYYDRGMYAYTSCDSRYVMSEGLKAPASVDADHRFVGWA